jgi:hypothetical protein
MMCFVLAPNPKLSVHLLDAVFEIRIIPLCGLSERSTNDDPKGPEEDPEHDPEDPSMFKDQ